ncbi:AAA family ATPase [Parvibaculum sp.]|uniref:bifunctional aminoglycoside phosphotransferase/ATP-binding protein n=1 Tax=Parvibaculum sp. TaxID=2024848 RepID=UPI003210FCD9
MSQEGTGEDVAAFLSRPETYGLAAGDRIECIETHASRVYLAGERVYKLKKRVDFGFLDFTTLEKRRAAAENEIALNRRTAPDIYLRTLPVRRKNGELQLGGSEGEIVDWLVEMRRFPAEGLFARLADEGRLTRGLIERLAADVASFHDHAEVMRERGGASLFARIVAGNDDNLKDSIGKVFDAEKVARLKVESDRMIEAHAALLDGRRDAGFVRRCHGDLHLGNVTLIDNRPVIFDCIEFSEDIASIDILYDLAFLLMDLEFRATTDERMRGFANRALNVYLDHVGEGGIGPTLEGLALLPLFVATRAAVRAKVTAVIADTEEKRDRSRAYLDFALAALAPRAPRMVAVGGLSGTGKSTLAMALAPKLGLPLGAVHLRSDIVRKRLFNVAPLERLPEAAYAKNVGRRVYDEMLTLAGTALGAGMTVVVDAVFSREGERGRAERLAAEAGVPFEGIWLEAPASVLEARVASRAAEALDPSDADVRVLHQQLAYDLGTMRWAKVDASAKPGESLASAMRLLEKPQG